MQFHNQGSISINSERPLQSKQRRRPVVPEQSYDLVAKKKLVGQSIEQSIEMIEGQLSELE